MTGCNPRYVYLNKGNLNCDNIKNEFITSQFMHSKELMIPDRILKFLSKKHKEDFTFAKNGDEYNNTDIRVYPNKRIIYTGVSDDLKFGFVFYEKGGLAISKNLILYKITKKKVFVTQFRLKKAFPTIDLLKENIKEAACF